MKRERGIARCGLACCLCSETECHGCDSGDCPDSGSCLNRACSIQKGIAGCFACDTPCRAGILSKLKPYGFCQFIRQHDLDTLLSCLELNEQRGVVYHRQGIWGDYDEVTTLSQLMQLIETGRKEQ